MRINCYYIFALCAFSFACQPLVFDNSKEKETESESPTGESGDADVNGDSDKGVAESGGGNHNKIDTSVINVEVEGKVSVHKKSNQPVAKKRSAKISFEVKVDTKVRANLGSGSQGGSSDSIKDDSSTPTTDDSTVEIDRIEVVEKTKVSVKFIEETAGFMNTFGWYKIDQNNNILDVKVVWENASQVGSQYGEGPLKNGDVVTLGEVEKDVKLGFFIVANGFTENNLEHSDQAKFIDINKGVFEFRDGSSYEASSLAKLSSVSPFLWYKPVSGAPFVIESRTNEQVDYGYNAVYHTAADSENSLQLNPDNVNHIRHRVLEIDKRYSIEIEDLFYSPGASAAEFDGDYSDLIFELIFENVEVESTIPVVKSY